jgi:hypothetical protein
VLQPTTTIECGTTIQIEFYATENGVVSGDDKVRLSLFATSGDWCSNRIRWLR